MNYLSNLLFTTDSSNARGLSYEEQSPAWYGTISTRDFVPVGLGTSNIADIYSLLLPEINNNYVGRTSYSSKHILYCFCGYYTGRSMIGTNIQCLKGILMLNVNGQWKIVMLATRKKDEELSRRTGTRLYIDPIFESIEPTLFRYLKKNLLLDVMAGGTPVIYVDDIRGMYFDGIKIPKFTSLPQRIEWEKELVQVIPNATIVTDEEE